MKLMVLSELLELSDSGVWGDEDSLDGISILRSTNFNKDGTLDLSKISMRAIEEKKRISKTLLEGDLLLEKSGGGPMQPVGRVCLFKGDSQAHSFGNFIARLRPTAEVMSEYLFYFLWWFHSVGKTSHYQKQTTGIRNLEFKRYLSITVPVPSMTEQRKVVDLLSRAQSIVHLRWDAQQKAAELIPAILVDMFGDPSSNPKGWQVKKLIELTKFQSGGTPSKSRGDLWIGTLPWVSPKDMKVVEISDSIDHVSDAVLTETNLKLVPVGSLLIVVRGMILVHTVPVAQTSVPVVINQDMKALIPNSAVDSSYLLWALKVQHARILALVDTAAHGTKKLDTSKIEALEIPVPPIEMQRLFKRRADDVVSIVCQQADATVKAKATFDALLSRAFSSRR
jgi:type I restriction enzyme, S subunit